MFHLVWTESAMAGGGNDLNGDGRTDLLWHNTKTGGTAIWLLNGATIGSAAFPGRVSLAWQVSGIGDADGDDKANVIWYNTSPCPVVYWLLNGLTIMSQVFSGTVSMDGASPVDQASEPRHLQTSPQNRPYLPEP